MKREYKFIDLFAGCGGLSLGASRAGFVGKLAIEYQENAFNTFGIILSIQNELKNVINLGF